MLDTLTTNERFLIAMVIILALPYLIWRLCRTDYFAPLVVVQILTGILLGPGVLGKIYPEYYRAVFNPNVVQHLNGIAWWAVMIFVWIAGIELNFQKAWEHRRESAVTAGLALSLPFLFGGLVSLGLLAFDGWIGARGSPPQFAMGIGMACAVTALPILVLFMEKLEILRQPIGQRILRYASLDDLAIWVILAVILMDRSRIENQATFLVLFSLATPLFRVLMIRLSANDRWNVGLIWLTIVAFAADRAGLHFMVGSFLAGVIIDSDWFEQSQMDTLRQNVLLIVMPVFFLSTGLKTEWNIGGEAVFLVAAGLLLASTAGKLTAAHIAGKLLQWAPGDAPIIGWLLQTKALIMIIFAEILLDRGIISADAFTALLIMAVLSTMLTIPMVSARLAERRSIPFTPIEDSPD